MVSSIEMVEEFIGAFNAPDSVKDIPYIQDDATNKLCYSLIKEELDELHAALIEGNDVEALDALTDLQYVLDFAYLRLGFHNVKNRAFAEVHASNMSKLGADGKAILNEIGKVTKGPNYFKPNLVQFVEMLNKARSE